MGSCAELVVSAQGGLPYSIVGKGMAQICIEYAASLLDFCISVMQVTADSAVPMFSPSSPYFQLV